MKLKKFSLALLFFVINFLLLFTFLSPQKYELRVGERAQEDIRATKDIENKIETEKLIKKAVENVQPVYRINPTVQAEIKSDIDNFFEQIYILKDNKDLELEDKIKKFKEVKISEKSIAKALSMDKQRLEYLKRYIFETINQIMNTGITKDEIDPLKEAIADSFQETNKFKSDEKLLGIEIINAFLRPNKFLDIEKTQQKIEEAKSSVDKVIIKKGDYILYKGEIVTQEKIDIINSLGIIEKKGREDFFVNISIATILLILEGLLGIYLYMFHRNLLENERKLLLLILILITTLVLSLPLSVISVYIMPLFTASMLISILLDSKLAIVCNFLVSIMAYLAIGDQNLFIISLISGTFASFASLEIAQRRSIIFTGAKIGIVNFLLAISLGFMYTTNLRELFLNSLLSLLSGVFSSILVVGSLPLWEHYFDILTSLKLLEISNPNNEVLKRMLIETPGTYHHSIIVGNLAERACDRIGANSLLARVASYYHDIGKLTRPYFFKENQIIIENPHDKIIPTLSAKIIKDHISEGIDLAKRYKLPREIINIIKEHHGTTLVAYFYHKAKEEGLEVKQEDFRYEGPKPQSKESAVVMLADSTEAAIRSIKEPTKEKIEDMIEKIVSGKLNDKQLDESNLTLKDLEEIKKAFLEVMMGMFHERIEYPKEGGENR
ncbi:hypothetical protein SAMN05661008_00639 [Alkalithermobacter thermoalcaliphilus JW-YL-7 = DSM 7308]|uniref:7TM receptor with intracellular metal dependent phosphohydrolase n=1 Tax=Alkalithermobacter thermoalcaliphilus JW-YL-7 = DSM 7308 TaxID=1121328 RepID=A0A150FPZ6_CLOPD|nr:7TM receptor with intracellular metal dependent phosphohydrolase [[Clostridium] paradoxum JW-YL-7 = DSM 7308]SHK64796.1 hypothetical protein SAMN05661008_00639 [[Clostridium] paradoxum JW-YL-7 = DSM 7308]